jgi:hypothetical protein
LGGVDWIMVFALALLVLGRHVLNLWERAALRRLGDGGEGYDGSVPVTETDADSVLLGR